MGGASLAKLVGQTVILDVYFSACMVKISRLNVVKLKKMIWVNMIILKPKSSKINQKLVWQAIKLVWQKPKLVGQPPHQLHRKLHPCAVPHGRVAQ